MLRKMSAIVKLIGICTFLWVQALQADHSADLLVDNQHENCLVCKSASDPLSAQDAIPTLTPAEYIIQKTEAALYNGPSEVVANPYQVRGPPTVS
jgi:hypothetical protein